MDKFEIHIFQVHPWNLIKHLAIPLCINITIWSYKFCPGLRSFCKTIKQRVLLTPTYQNQPCTRSCFIGLPYKEILPPDAEIFSLAET